MTRKKSTACLFFLPKRRMFFPPSSAFILSRPSWMLSGFFRGFFVIQPISHCTRFLPLVDELRRWRHQWKAETSTGPYRKANWPWYGIAFFFDSIQLLLLLDFVPLEEKKRDCASNDGVADSLSSAFWPASSFHPFNVVASALLHTQRIEKFGEPKKKNQKARPRLSIVSFSPLQTPASNTTTSSHFSVVFLFSYWSWVSLSRGTPCTLCTISGQKSISDSIYPSENK